MSFFKKITGLNTGTATEVAVASKNQTTNEPLEQSMFTDDWLEQDYEEGQLAIDVYQTTDAIVVKSTIAGVKPEDIDIALNNDMLTVRGTRAMGESVADEDYFYQECYWGSFSRSVILPVEVVADKVDATIENGVLTIVLPKAHNEKQIAVKVKD